MPTRPADLMVDVSKWNAGIDWTALRHSGVTRAYVRVWTGWEYDPQWRAHVGRAKRVGIKVYPYVVAQPDDPPVTAATRAMQIRSMAAWDVVTVLHAGGGRTEAVPLAVDWELPGLTPGWLQRFHEAYRGQYVVYSSQAASGLPEHLVDPPGWWVAAWHPERDGPPHARAPFKRVVAWQWTNHGLQALDQSEWIGGLMSDVPADTPTPPADHPPEHHGPTLDQRVDALAKDVFGLEARVNQLGEHVKGLDAAVQRLESAGGVHPGGPSTPLVVEPGSVGAAQTAAPGSPASEHREDVDGADAPAEAAVEGVGGGMPDGDAAIFAQREADAAALAVHDPDPDPTRQPEPADAAPSEASVSSGGEA